MSAKNEALRYAEKGWEVLPVHGVTDKGHCSCGTEYDYAPAEVKHAIGKHPHLGVKGHRYSSKDPAQIEAWWKEWPDANLSIATGEKSKIIVLDVDKKSWGLESLQNLWSMYGEFPPTPIVRSGGGGLHFYFAHPGYEVRGRRDMLPGIDVMADGGRIVAPPSKHKSGAKYEWDPTYTSDLKPAAIPVWLLSMILSKQSKRRRSEGEEKIPTRAPEPVETEEVPTPKVIRNRRFRF